MANVYSLVAKGTGCKNNDISGASIPLTNLGGTYPGPFNPNLTPRPIFAPSVQAVDPFSPRDRYPSPTAIDPGCKSDGGNLKDWVHG